MEVIFEKDGVEKRVTAPSKELLDETVAQVTADKAVATPDIHNRRHAGKTFADFNPEKVFPPNREPSGR